jgi:hypothetical protein
VVAWSKRGASVARRPRGGYNVSRPWSFSARLVSRMEDEKAPSGE